MSSDDNSVEVVNQTSGGRVREEPYENLAPDDKTLMDFRIEDMFYSHHSLLPKGFYGRAYFAYIFHVFQYLYIAIYMDWTIFIRHPINFLLLIAFFSFSIFALFVVGLFLTVYSLTQHEDTVISKWAKVLERNSNNDINASANTVIRTLKEGVELLGMIENPLKPSGNPNGSMDRINENLDKVLALKTLLYFSTLVYKREAETTSKIHDCIKELKYELDYIDEQQNKNCYRRVYKTLWDYEKEIRENDESEVERESSYKFKDIEKKIRNLIRKDERVINEELENIEDFGINFTSISELNTENGGSYCGMFWSEKENLIVVSFKGTSPTNFAEWLNNLAFQSVDARNYLFGQVHRGFYHYLFPVDEEKAGKDYPCQKIIDSIDQKAQTLKKLNNEKVNLWIVGHSLGGALATLFYARLLTINFDEHENWRLQGAVTFASPAVGDNHFAAHLAALINDPRNETSPLWRIVLDKDLVPKLPYRACEKHMRKYGYHYNVLMNYTQVGEKVIFHGGKKEPTSIQEFFRKTNDDIESYCKSYSKHTLLRKIKDRALKLTFSPYHFHEMVISHGAVDGYFKVLVDYEKKLKYDKRYGTHALTTIVVTDGEKDGKEG